MKCTPAELLAWLQQQRASGVRRVIDLQPPPPDVDAMIANATDAQIERLLDALEQQTDAQGRLRHGTD